MNATSGDSESVVAPVIFYSRRQSMHNGRRRSVPCPLIRSRSEIVSNSRDPNNPFFTPRTSYQDALIPISVAYMENVTIDINVSPSLSTSKDTFQYIMTVHHLISNETWQYQKSFDDFRRFQQKLLKDMEHGHFCTADCPWLYTFVKSYFPKKHLFQFASSRVIKARQEGLQQFFTRFHAFILKKNNHGCAILANVVINQFVDFVYGERLASHMILDSPLENMSSFVKSTSSLLSSSGTSKSTESITTSASDDDRESSTGSFTSTVPSCSTMLPTMHSHCQLCTSPLEGEANSSNPKAPSSTTPETNESDTELISPSTQPEIINKRPSVTRRTSSNQVGGYRRNIYYVTTLGCGHQFHDECILPTLNQTLRCPTCNHLEVK